MSGPPTSPAPQPARDEIMLEYLERLQYPPYPVQEAAIEAWAASDHGILLSAPTGTGKTLVAEAAVYEALRTGKSLYYSTPLIALTDQKLLELQATAQRWGYPASSVGLVTGHRTVNPDAPIKVVVAEVLLNRLLHREAFDFSSVSAVVMDEFHNFSEPQRGIVWELPLFLLPKHVRVMLLSATIGAAQTFVGWMANALDRPVTLVEGKERKVPLHFHWVGDDLLPDFMESMAQGGTAYSETLRRTPALLFCFDRNICWDTCEVLRGKDLFAPGQRDTLLKRLDDFDFSIGAGAKIRTFLARGIGIHHAGLLPRYRRIVETLFQEKLLSVCVCTETLAAGLNLPAKSVVMSTLVKGPRDKKKLIETGVAQQIFGRAGRPQYDTEGHVFALAHEDDVKLARWQTKYDSIPETEKDPKLMAAKKALLKKKPTRSPGVTYWNPDQFAKLQTAPPAKLVSRGRLTWRWLAYLLDASPAVQPIRDVMRRRLMDVPTLEAELKRLTKMLVTLHGLGVVVLDPPPPAEWVAAAKPAQVRPPTTPSPGTDEEGDPTPSESPPAEVPAAAQADLMASLRLGSERISSKRAPAVSTPGASSASRGTTSPPIAAYDPVTATPSAKLVEVMLFKAVHPLYGLWLKDHLGQANDAELIQILESTLEIPGSVARSLRVPRPEALEAGALTAGFIDPAMLIRGLASQEDMYPPPVSEQLDLPPELRKYPIPLAEKVRMVFESEVDHAGWLFITPVWAVGDLLDYGGNFDQWVRTRDLTKQEGILFKHVLRMILLCGEFSRLTPTGATPELWRERLTVIANRLTDSARAVDPQSTDEQLEELSETV